MITAARAAAGLLVLDNGLQMNRCWQSEQCKGNYKEKERKENQGECEEKLEEQQDYENSKEYTDPYTP